MRLVVTGSEGQVARALAERAAGAGDVELVAVGRPLLDLARPETIAPALAKARPDIVISAAAYTAVDQAEDEPELAMAVNGAGAGAVAAAAAALGVPVIHLSTDYVFDGTSSEPYGEEAPTAPRSAYGRSKLAGEEAVAAANPRHIVLRTAWVYSPFGRNFVKTMLKLAETRDEVSVVADQTGNPTSAHDIADGVLVAARAALVDGFEGWGTFHLAGSGETSWAGLAAHVLRTSGGLGGPTASVREIGTSDYPTKAARPASSRLATERFASTFGWRAPDWRTSCEAVVTRLVRAGVPA